MQDLLFKTIELLKNGDLCIKFRRDAYQCSFRNGDAIFARENGQDTLEYLNVLKQGIREFPKGYVHAYLQGKIVGQIEMHVKNEEFGYINLFYLIPEFRGTGLGRELHEYAESTMKEAGVSRVQLSVGPINQRALSYYSKNGWNNIGFRPPGKKVYLLEISL